MTDGVRQPLEARYVNYFNVGHNAHEFLFDFGQFHLQSAQSEDDTSRVQIIRIIMGPLFAKAFLLMVREAIEQYEGVHGSLDVSEEPREIHG